MEGYTMGENKGLYGIKKKELGLAHKLFLWIAFPAFSRIQGL